MELTRKELITPVSLRVANSTAALYFFGVCRNLVQNLRYCVADTTGKWSLNYNPHTHNLELVRLLCVHIYTIQEQFTFIHDAILESVTCGDTQIAATNLRVNIAKMKKRDAQNQSHGFHHRVLT